jgi:phosphonopyruvate decarboxylase
MTTTETKAIDAAAALRAIAAARGEAVVLTTMMVSRGWGGVSTRSELDLPLGGAMGKLSSVGLGIALARPERKVIVLDGDGSLLMSLGSLVTIGGMAPRNLVHVVCQNGVYEVTGCQPIPGVERLDFGQIALGAGFRRAETFDDLAALERALPELLAADGPTFVTLKLRPFSWGDGPRRRTIDAVRDLTDALRSG